MSAGTDVRAYASVSVSFSVIFFIRHPNAHQACVLVPVEHKIFEADRG